MSRQPVWVGHFSTSVAIWPNWGDYNVKLMCYFTYIGYHTKNIVHIPGCPYGWALFNESCYRGRPSPHRLTYGQTVARWNFSPPCKSQNIWRKKTSSFFKDHFSRCVEEGRGAQLPTPHSASELAFIGDHFIFQHFLGPTYIFSIILIVVSFIRVDLGRQESWFGPIDGLFLSFSAFVDHFVLFQHFLWPISFQYPDESNWDTF